MKKKIIIAVTIVVLVLLLALIGRRILLEREYKNVYIEIRHDEMFVEPAVGYEAGHTSYEITKKGFVYRNKKFIKKINQNTLKNIESYIYENTEEKEEGIYSIEYYVKVMKDGEWKTFGFGNGLHKGYDGFTHLEELINE